jgi:hypothetical protein
MFEAPKVASMGHTRRCRTFNPIDKYGVAAKEIKMYNSGNACLNYLGVKSEICCAMCGGT